MSAAETARVRRDAEIIPADLAVKAMRDSGYKNTAYALAELIENSVQAEATDIEVFCLEERQLINERERRRIRQIAVLDNGKGMSPPILRLALQFGNGMHLNDRSGIGRFGMGLPNSSISQCRRVDVWSWQNGPDNAMHSFLDVDKIEARELTHVPEPDHSSLPAEWRKRAKALGTTGTLIVWQNFDEHRLTWRGGRATLENTEILVGRMYRKFLHNGKLNIRLVALDFQTDAPIIDRPSSINDPLYLMTPSSTPVPFDKAPMFQKWGEADEEFTIPFNDTEHTVEVRISWAKPETVPSDGTDRGRQPYGKPTLDEVFGVPNNKQAAALFSQMAQFDWESEAEPGEKYTQVKERLRSNGDPRAELMDIAQYIRDQLSKVRARLKDQTKGLRGGSGGKRHDETSVEDRASTKFKERADQGYKTEQDNQVFTDEAKVDLVKDLVEKKHYPEQSAEDIADAVEKRKKRVIFVEAEMDGYAFFKVEQRPGGITEIIFNTAHPAHEQLMRALEANVDGATDKDLLDRIVNASDTLRMLFAAWARYEMEDMPNRGRINDMRQEWGKMARVFLETGET